MSCLSLRIEYQCYFDHILELPDVTGRPIFHGRLKGSRGNGRDEPKFQFLYFQADEVLDQGRDIDRPFSPRRYTDGKTFNRNQIPKKRWLNLFCK